MKSPKSYSIGRTVIYVPKNEDVPRSLPETYNGATECAAVIVATWEHTGYQNSEVNLKVICDGPGEAWRTSVPYDENGAPGTWHWPPLKP